VDRLIFEDLPRERDIEPPEVDVFLRAAELASISA
jgi:hypothetical protein